MLVTQPTTAGAHAWAPTAALLLSICGGIPKLTCDEQQLPHDCWRVYVSLQEGQQQKYDRDRPRQLRPAACNDVCARGCCSAWVLLLC